MATTVAAAPRPRKGTQQAKPGLVFFHSAVSGNCRRVEGFLAQVLQRRRNHGTFKLYRVAQEERPDLVERFSSARAAAARSRSSSGPGSTDGAAVELLVAICDPVPGVVGGSLARCGGQARP